jgi:hypothetical protein
MFSFCQFGLHLLLARFMVVVSQHLMMVLAYAPIDVYDTFVKDAFHLLMFGCLKIVPFVDKVVVLGDFNVELGCGLLA